MWRNFCIENKVKYSELTVQFRKNIVPPRSRISVCISARIPSFLHMRESSPFVNRKIFGRVIWRKKKYPHCRIPRQLEQNFHSKMGWDTRKRRAENKRTSRVPIDALLHFYDDVDDGAIRRCFKQILWSMSMVTNRVSIYLLLGEINFNLFVPIYKQWLKPACYLLPRTDRKVNCCIALSTTLLSSAFLTKLVTTVTSLCLLATPLNNIQWSN